MIPDREQIVSWSLHSKTLKNKIFCIEASSNHLKSRLKITKQNMMILHSNQEHLLEALKSLLDRTILVIKEF